MGRSKDTLDKIVEILESKKGRDISIIDLRNISLLADYFVICSGSSTTHIKALADEVEEKMLEKGVACHHKEGYESARWILMDYRDIVVHIFHEEERNFYKLERLWSDGITTYSRES